MLGESEESRSTKGNTRVPQQSLQRYQSLLILDKAPLENLLCLLLTQSMNQAIKKIAGGQT